VMRLAVPTTVSVSSVSMISLTDFQHHRMVVEEEDGQVSRRLPGTGPEATKSGCSVTSALPLRVVMTSW